MPKLVENPRSSQKLVETVGDLLRGRERLMSAYSAAVQRQQAARMNYLNRRIQETNSFLKSLGQIETEFTARQAGPHFVVSSLFLYECFEQLTADRKEEFFFVTGAEINGVLVLSQICTFDHISRTEVGVKGDPKAIHRLLARLSQFGHRCLGRVHVHPGRGSESTQPSGIDIKYQAELEAIGCENVAAIFSRDGYIRFFRIDNNFEIKICGTGVEHVTGTIYHLTNLD